MDGIETACRAFEKSVEDLIGKIRKRKRRDGAEEESDSALASGCKGLVDHATHILRTLTAKRASLRNGVEAFRELSQEVARQFASIGSADGQLLRRRHAILRKWFSCYLRLRDGFVLLESGERRHPRDGEGAGGNGALARKFPSRLSAAFRRDGVTRKFSSERGYTGAGYDEFYDEDVGLQRRLLDALAKMDGRRSRNAMRERLFDRDGSGAKVFEFELDEHINKSKILRERLNDIQGKFVDDVNMHLASLRVQKKNKREGSLEKLKLVTDDKSERMTLGQVDIARQGNAFTIKDPGGSLPFGTSTSRGKLEELGTVIWWREKFGLIQPVQNPQPNAEKSKRKKRKFVIKDSSDEEGADGVDSPPVLPRKKQSLARADQEGGDGLSIRVRKATDVTYANGKDADGKTTSINEMKRQLGVNSALLEQAHEHAEDEQLHSKMAADEEDMQESFLGDASSSALSKYVPLVDACLESRSELCKNDMYKNDNVLLRESQEYWDDFFDSMMQWKDQFQPKLTMDERISKGLLDKSSDHAYSIRENFREASMHLGNDCMEVYVFFSARLQKLQAVQTQSASVPSSSKSLEDSLSNVCGSFLRLAEETFTTTINILLEQEHCQISCAGTIGSHWEKGQHLLLRGRAHQNVGRVLYETAHHCEFTSKHQSVKKNRAKNLLRDASKEFLHAISRAKSLRHNTVHIHGHSCAQNVSTQNNISWEAEAMIHSLEACSLEAVTSGFRATCLWELDCRKEAEEILDGFFNTTNAFDLTQLASTEGISHNEIVEALDNVYWLAKKVAELASRSLERTQGWDVKVGDNLLRILRKAMKYAALASSRLFSFVNLHSIDHDKSCVATKAVIEEEERDISDWWETVKVRARQKLSNVPGGGADKAVVAPRGEIANDIVQPVEATQFPRRTFIQESGLQRRASTIRSKRPKKKIPDNLAISGRFNAAFGSGSSTIGSVAVAPPLENASKYRKWGDEILEENEKERSCPPLPPGLSSDVVQALKKKLGCALPEMCPLAGY